MIATTLLLVCCPLLPQGAPATDPLPTVAARTPQSPVLEPDTARFVWWDWSGDGRLDALGASESHGARLLQQGADGRFEDCTHAAGLGDLTWSRGAFGDFDRDGRADLFVLGLDGSPRLFLQADAGRFLPVDVDVEVAVATAIDADRVAGQAWTELRVVDVDADGRLDVHVTGPTAHRVLRGRGDGSFDVVDLGPLAGTVDPSSAATGTGISVQAGGSAGGPAAGTAAPAVQSQPLAGPVLVCAGSVDDLATGACLEASSVPLLGRLYPISSTWFVSPGGLVGVGTTSPGARLDVNGVARASQLVSTVGTGTSPLAISSRTLVPLLNCDQLDGLDSTAFRQVSVLLTTSDLAPGSVTTDKLALLAVTSAVLADGAVGTSKLALGAVVSDRIADGAVTLARIAPNAVDAQRIVDGSVQAADLAANSVTTAKLADASVTTDKLVDGSVSTDKLETFAVNSDALADGAVSASKIQNGAVGPFALALGSVTSSALLDGTVTEADLAAASVGNSRLQDASVNSFKVLDGSLQSVDLASGAVTTDKLAIGAVISDRIANGAVTLARIGASAVDSARIVDGGVLAADIASGAVTNVKLANNSVSTDKLEQFAVTSDSIADGAVIASKLAPGAISAGALAPGSVTSSSILDGTVTEADLAAASVGGSKLQDSAVNSFKILDDSIQSVDLGAASVTTEKLAVGAVVTDRIAAGAVTLARIGANAVDSGRIVDGSILGADIAVGAVGSLAILNGSITSIDLADGSINASALAPGAVDGSAIADGSLRDVDVNASAAIQGTKIRPDFGTQSVTSLAGAVFGNPTGSRAELGAASAPIRGLGSAVGTALAGEFLGRVGVAASNAGLPALDVAHQAGSSAARVTIQDAAGTSTAPALHVVATGDGAARGVLVESLGLGNTGAAFQVVHSGAGVGLDISSGALPLRLDRSINAGTLIEARNTQDIEFRVDSSGDVFCDGAFVSGGADYAEWIELAVPTEVIEPGDVVGVRAGKVSKTLAGAERFMVASTKPAVIGNHADAADDVRAGHVVIAFVGRAPVKVRGRAAPGDVLVPSASGDGTAVALAPERVSASDLGRVIGTAWSAAEGDGVNLVDTLVGVGVERAASAALERLERELRMRDEVLVRLAARLDALERR